LSIDVRQVPEASLRDWLDTVNLAFGEHTTEEQWALDRPLTEPDRVLGAYDNDLLVGGATANSYQLTVPGGTSVAAAGVSAVGVLPTHRRQGALTQLMERQLRDVRERGEPVAILWASEGAIYQRFGYGLATLTAGIDIERQWTALSGQVRPRGAMRLVPRDEARRVMPSVFDAVRPTVPGFINRSPAAWDALFADLPQHRAGGGERFYVVHERDSHAAGYVMYRIKEDWTGAGHANTLMVVELIGVDPAASIELWRYVFGVDLMSRITARRGPANHPLLLQLAHPRRASLQLGDGLWLRIVDVPGALGGRRYERDGSLVLQVADDFVPDWAGTWRLTASDGEGHVEPASGQADLRVDTNDLAAVYLGAFSFADLGRAGRTHELKPGAWLRADALFSTSVPPWCPVMF
jgi:predicted acetyltransferase